MYSFQNMLTSQTVLILQQNKYSMVNLKFKHSSYKMLNMNEVFKFFLQKAPRLKIVTRQRAIKQKQNPYDEYKRSNMSFYFKLHYINKSSS